jgi:hypothetical protein
MFCLTGAENLFQKRRYDAPAGGLSQRRLEPFIRALRNAVGKRVRNILMHNVHNYLCVQDTHPFLLNALIHHCLLYIGMPKGSRKKGMFLRFPKTKKAVTRPLLQFAIRNAECALISRFL